MSLQFRDEDVVQDYVKGLVGDPGRQHQLSFLVHRCCHSTVEDHQSGQILSALGEAVLTLSDHLLILHVP